MSNLTLVLTFDKKLDCTKCDDVLIWVRDPTKLSINIGVTDPTKYFNFIEAKVKSVATNCNGIFTYTFTYTDSDLVNPAVPLVPCDIKQVCCEGCLTQFVKDTFNRLNT